MGTNHKKISFPPSAFKEPLKDRVGFLQILFGPGKIALGQTQHPQIIAVGRKSRLVADGIFLDAKLPNHLKPLFIIALRAGQIALVLAYLSQLPINRRQHPMDCDPIFLLPLGKNCAEFRRLSVGFLSAVQPAQLILVISQIAQGEHIFQSVRPILALLILRPLPICQLFLPVHGDRIIPRHAFAAAVHRRQLFHSLGQPSLGGPSNQFPGRLAVYLYIDAAQIRQPDKEVVLRVGVVLPDRQPLGRLQQRRRKRRLVLRGGRSRQPWKPCRQPLPVGGRKLHWQHQLIRFAGLGVFQRHHIVAWLGEVRGNRQRKQAALLQRFGNRGVEILARGQKFVVPNRDIPAEIVFMDQPHQLLSVFTVFLAIAQKNIGVKGRPYLGRQFVSHQYRREKFL